MAGGTSAFDMIKRLKENENLRKKKYFKNKDSYTLKTETVNSDTKTATKEQLEEIRKKTIAENLAARRRSIRLLILSVVILLVLIPIFIFFVNWLMD